MYVGKASSSTAGLDLAGYSMFRYHRHWCPGDRPGRYSVGFVWKKHYCYVQDFDLFHSPGFLQCWDMLSFYALSLLPLGYADPRPRYMAVHDHRHMPFAVAAHLPTALLLPTTATSMPPMMHLVDQKVCAEHRWQESISQIELLMSLAEARSGVGGIEDKQSLGPERKVGLNRKWEIHEKEGVMAFATDSRW